MDALPFLAKAAGKIGPLYVLHGDEAFLKRQVVEAVRRRALGDDADDAAVSSYPGDKAQFADVMDELATAPFFAPRRVVVVDSADPFVTKFRPLLEKKIDKLPATGVLVLDVKTWPSNTRLAKMVDAAATIVCKAPHLHRLPAWCGEWAAARHGKQLPPDAAGLLVELVGPEMGLLDSELEKLAIYVGDKKTIDAADVDRLVGHNSSENVFQIFDAIADGKPGVALRMLDRLFELGEEPMKLSGALGSQLRKLAQAGRLATQGMTVAAALARVNVPTFAVAANDKLLRHLGRERAAKLYDWLIELNFGIRGGSPLPERTQFEQLLVRMARPVVAPRAVTSQGTRRATP
jgi:DNA polymerase-3 subunit delta